jgi:S1-C subfamily serine protease
MEMDVTFSDGSKYTANVIANDIYSDIAVRRMLVSPLNHES